MVRELWRVVSRVLSETVPDYRAEDAVMRILRAEGRKTPEPAGPYCSVSPHRNYRIKRKKRPTIEHTVTPLRRRA